MLRFLGILIAAALVVAACDDDDAESAQGASDEGPGEQTDEATAADEASDEAGEPAEEVSGGELRIEGEVAEIAEAHWCENDELAGSEALRKLQIMGIDEEGEWILNAMILEEEGKTIHEIQTSEIAPGVSIGAINVAGSRVYEDDERFPYIEREGDRVVIEGSDTGGDGDEVTFSAEITLPSEPRDPALC